MRPLHECRGKREKKGAVYRSGTPSMRPLHECRGKRSGGGVYPSVIAAFNEAPARMQGKTSLRASTSAPARSLQ